MIVNISAHHTFVKGAFLKSVEKKEERMVVASEASLAFSVYLALVNARISPG